MKMCSVVLLLALACFTGCGKSQPKTPVPGTSDHVVLKVWVSSSGVIQVDGNTTSLGDLDRQIYEVRMRNGVVWLYCASQQGKAARVAAGVSDLASRRQVPLKISNMSDFSDM